MILRGTRVMKEVVVKLVSKLCLLLCPILATLLVGCGTTSTSGVRAVWVTRWDYETREDVSRIMEDCADAGFDTVLFQVRGNGTAFYDSAIEPWAEELGGKHPGFDPLRADRRFQALLTRLELPD